MYWDDGYTPARQGLAWEAAPDWWAMSGTNPVAHWGSLTSTKLNWNGDPWTVKTMTAGTYKQVLQSSEFTGGRIKYNWYQDGKLQTQASYASFGDR